MSVRRFAAALCFLLALAGCSGDPQPRVDPTPTASTSTGGPSPIESATAEPSEEPESAEEFVRNWVTLVNQMRRDGDGTDFRQVSSDCKDCLAIADAMEEIHSNGGTISGGVWRILSTQLLDQRGDTATVIAQLKTERTKYTEGPGAPPKTLPGGRGAIRLVLSRRHDGWAAAEFYLESQ